MAISSLSYLFLFSIILTTTSISVHVHGQCLEDQKAALLELKRGWKFDPSYSKKLVHWNETYDCCSWGGVRCNNDGTVQGLYLTNESISGEIHTSSSIFSLGSLLFLELDNNSLSGAIPHRLFSLWSVTLSNNLFDNISQPESYESPPPPTGPFVIATNFSMPTVFLSLANNRLSGDIPSFFCKALPTIQGLDLSFNNFSGSIPRCLLQNPYIRMLNLKGNKLDGSIPDQFTKCALTTLDVSNNELTGEIPKSIARCESLQVLNVGYNNFDGVFPCMLPPSLHVLVLRSNRFRGEVRCDMSWPDLQIVDVSYNNLSGNLSALRFSSWEGMIIESNSSVKRNYSEEYNVLLLGLYHYYRDEVTLSIKGVELKIVKIWPEFTCIDFSSNNFNGSIPDAIGDLSTLYLLNLSHNALTGSIPRSLGALSDLGALDLSVNQLGGRIPEELARLTFLSFLNVSNNVLVGGIPNGRQFHTFSSNSFEGNVGLCGFPLNRSCSTPPPSPAPSKSKDKEITWEYVFAALGYVVGSGSIVLTLLCCGRVREPYFEKIEEIADKIFYERGRRKRHERRVRRRREEKKRREERRNGLRRQRSW